MFASKKEKAQRPDCNGSVYAGSVCDICNIKAEGSFTVEAAYMIPLVLLCLFLPLWLGIDMYMEVRAQAISIEQKKTADVISEMYQKEWLEEYWEVIKEGHEY